MKYRLCRRHKPQHPHHVKGSLQGHAGREGALISKSVELGVLWVLWEAWSHRVNLHNNNNEILIKREPLVCTRAWRAVQKKKRKKEARTVQQQ